MVGADLRVADAAGRRRGHDDDEGEGERSKRCLIHALVLDVRFGYASG